MSYTIFSCGVEYVLDGWTYNDTYTQKTARYVSSDGGVIYKTFNV